MVMFDYCSPAEVFTAKRKGGPRQRLGYRRFATAAEASDFPMAPPSILNEHYEGDGEIVFQHACKLGCEGIVSKRLGSPYRSGRSPHWVKVKNPKAPAVKREAEEDWGR
jgi:ATP-dependent DNA ligase